MAVIESLPPNKWTLVGRAPFNIRGDAILVSSPQQPNIDAPGLHLTIGASFDFVGSDCIWARPAPGGVGKLVISPLLDNAERVTTYFAFSGDVLSGEVYSATGLVENVAIRSFFNDSTSPRLALTDDMGGWMIALPSSTDIVSYFRLEIDASQAHAPAAHVIYGSGLILDLDLSAGLFGPAWM